MDRYEQMEETCKKLGLPVNHGEGDFPEFRQIFQPVIFGDLAFAGSLSSQKRELLVLSVLATIQALPQLQSHTRTSLHCHLSPVEIEETIFLLAPLLGIPRTLNALYAMCDVFHENNIPLPLPSQKVTNDQTRHEIGRQLQEKLYGTSSASNPYSWLPEPFDQVLPNLISDYVFGDLYSRGGLDSKMKEMILVVSLAAAGDEQTQLYKHAKAAIDQGASKEELACALIYTSGYMGLPRAINALLAIKDLIEVNESEKETDRIRENENGEAR